MSSPATREELEARRDDIVARHGEWTYDIPLPHGVWTRGDEGVPQTRLRRIMQAIEDLGVAPLDRCRVLDLGCLEGQFAIECAHQGAEVLGVEAREPSLVKARFAKEALGLDRLQFVQDDVRNVAPEHYGEFDVVICSGILYHLDTPDVFHLLRHTSEMTRRLAVIDTHVSLRPTVTVEFDGRTYHGHRVADGPATYTATEADAGGPPSMDELWASVDNDTSFHFTRPSLLNALAAVGFSSVHECLNPPHLNFGAPGIEHPDRCTFAAVKGRDVRLVTSPAADGLREDWPEGALTYALSDGLRDDPQRADLRRGEPVRSLRRWARSLKSMISGTPSMP